jgi:hypothetical protein
MYIHRLTFQHTKNSACYRANTLRTIEEKNRKFMLPGSKIYYTLHKHKFQRGVFTHQGFSKVCLLWVACRAQQTDF